MQKICYGLVVAVMLLCLSNSAVAQVSIGIGLPNLSIGINLPLYPQLTPVPGYPVYYAPQVNGNYFFYDGMYWVYQDDNWYASSWYNGPWAFVQPEYVPLFILRIPVRYYRHPPAYFRGWQPNAPPRWGQHWGHDWEQRRVGWDKWKRGSAPAPAPLPAYQRQYSGDRYPRVEQQNALRNKQYRYQPRDKVVREHFKSQAEQKATAPAQRGRQEAAPVKRQTQHEPQRSAPVRQGGEHVQQPAPVQIPHQQQGPAIHEQRQQAPRPQMQEQRPQQRGERQERGQGQDKDDERGRGRDR